MPPSRPLAPSGAGHARPRELKQWLSVVSVALGAFVLVSAEFLPIGLLSRIATDLGVSEGTAGLMVTTPGIMAAIAAPLAAFGLRRVDRRVLLLMLTALVLLSNVIAFLARDFQVLLLGRVLLGLSVGGFWAFAGAVGRRLVDERHGGVATALVMAGISLGTVLGLPLGSAIGNWLGWRASFELGALLSIVALAAQSLLLPPLKPDAQGPGARWSAAFGHPLLRAGFVFSMLVVFGHFAAYTYLEPFLTQRVGLHAVGLSLALAAYGAAGLVGNFVAAPLAERDFRLAFLGVAALLAVSVAALGLAPASPAWSIAAVVSWGLAFGAVPTCVQIWVFKASPETFESSSAFMVTTFQVALALGAGAGGAVADNLGLRAALLAGAVAIAIGALALATWQRMGGGRGRAGRVGAIEQPREF